MCRNLLKAHIKTGCDWISRVSMKNKALTQLELLNKFAEGKLNKEIID